MKRLFCFLLLIISTIPAFTQNIIFPGLSETQKQKLLSTRIAVPLPTWIPQGFSVTGVVTKTGKSVKIENKILTITYSKKLPKGSLQFTIEAGFDGLGSLPYDGDETVKSKVGNIFLYYEPVEEVDDGKKVKYTGFIITEWFTVKNLDFHVDFSHENEEIRNNRATPKLSKADVKKILQSLQVLR